MIPEDGHTHQNYFLAFFASLRFIFLLSALTCCARGKHLLVVNYPRLPKRPPPEGAKKLRTDRDREGEAPAEPHGARTCWGDGSPGGSPSQFFSQLPFEGRIPSL
ncbi:MAG: hypothetical protein DMG06_28645 [Acidobacteria bacterium]|nr:MAG: hypothetical protein DMG06_28645 [Acidobacteriota bacterium]